MQTSQCGSGKTAIVTGPCRSRMASSTVASLHLQEPGRYQLVIGSRHVVRWKFILLDSSKPGEDGFLSGSSAPRGSTFPVEIVKRGDQLKPFRAERKKGAYDRFHRLSIRLQFLGMVPVSSSAISGLLAVGTGYGPVRKSSSVRLFGLGLNPGKDSLPVYRRDFP